MYFTLIQSIENANFICLDRDNKKENVRKYVFLSET